MRDILVIGAGPAGCVGASYLVKKGYSVTVIEKSKFPRFTIGESLLPLSMAHFEEVELLEPLKKAKFEVKSGALFLRGKNEEMDISFAENFTPGWTWTWQVPRDEFDDILAQETEKKGVEFHYESQLENIEFLPDQVKVKFTKDGNEQEERFRYILDSSGSAGVLSKMLSLEVERKGTNRKSLFTQVVDDRADGFPRSKRISFDVLEQDLWFWVIPFSNGKTSLGFVGDKKWFDLDHASNNELFEKMLKKSPRFEKRFEGLPLLYDATLIEDYTCTAKQMYGDRFVMAGNTTGFIDPVFSSGVAIATESGLLAAKLIDKELSGEEVDWQTMYVDHMAQAREVFGAFVDSWYDGHLHDIFFYENIRMELKEQLTSVLAGYVWDMKNPFVRKKYKLIKTLAHVIKLEKEGKGSEAS